MSVFHAAEWPPVRDLQSLKEISAATDGPESKMTVIFEAEHNASYQIPRSLLSAHASDNSYFSIVAQSADTFVLPDCSTETFALFLHWQYTGSLAPMITLTDDNLNAMTQEDWERVVLALFRLWGFARAYFGDDFQDRIMENLIAGLNTVGLSLKLLYNALQFLPISGPGSFTLVKALFVAARWSVNGPGLNEEDEEYFEKLARMPGFLVAWQDAAVPAFTQDSLDIDDYMAIKEWSRTSPPWYKDEVGLEAHKAIAMATYPELELEEAWKLYEEPAKKAVYARRHRRSARADRRKHRDGGAEGLAVSRDGVTRGQLRSWQNVPHVEASTIICPALDHYMLVDGAHSAGMGPQEQDDAKDGNTEYGEQVGDSEDEEEDGEDSAPEFTGYALKVDDLACMDRNNDVKVDVTLADGTEYSISKLMLLRKSVYFVAALTGPLAQPNGLRMPGVDTETMDCFLHWCRSEKLPACLMSKENFGTQDNQEYALPAGTEWDAERDDDGASVTSSQDDELAELKELDKATKLDKAAMRRARQVLLVKVWGLADMLMIPELKELAKQNLQHIASNERIHAQAYYMACIQSSSPTSCLVKDLLLCERLYVGQTRRTIHPEDQEHKTYLDKLAKLPGFALAMLEADRYAHASSQHVAESLATAKLTAGR